MEKKSKVKDGKYIVIASFMLTELELKGNELLVYAIIYGFSQTDGMKGFSGSLQYLADWTNSTKQGVIKNLKSLIDKGYITKEETSINGIKYCTYQTVELEEIESIKQSLTPCNSVEQGIKQSLTGYSTEFNGGIKQSLPNNIDIYTSKKLEDNIAPVEATPQTPWIENNKFIEDKKSSKGKKENIFEDFANGNTQLLQALKDFEDSRNKNRSKMTEYAKKLLISELQKFNPNDWIAILNQSVLNGWKSVYPLKNNGYQPNGNVNQSYDKSFQQVGEFKF